MKSARIPVLFLVMEFAPVNTTGNFRSLKFVKYLHEFGFDPVIVTLKEQEAAEFFNAKIDPSLMNDVPPETPVYRIHCDSAHDLYKNKIRSFITIYFSIKDNIARRWKKHLDVAIPDIIKKHKPALIFTSLPPFSCGKLAEEISNRFQIPLVVDMRDFWAMWGSTPFPSKIHYALTLREERSIFASASAVLGVTPQLISQFRRSHPTIDRSKFHLVPNGFDKSTNAISSFTFPPNKSKIIIGYVGSFYYHPEGRENVFKPWWKKRGHHMLQYTPLKEDWLYRSPYFFLKTISELLERHPELNSVIELHFVGKKPSWFDSMVNEFGLGEKVVSHGFVSHAEAQKIQAGFDLILATSEKVMGGEHYCLPSKIFDYVGIGKPILGFVTEGIQKEFILKGGLGEFCDPDNTTAAAETLHSLITKGKTFVPDSDYLKTYHRRELSNELANVFHSTLTKAR